MSFSYLRFCFEINHFDYVTEYAQIKQDFTLLKKTKGIFIHKSIEINIFLNGGVCGWDVGVVRIGVEVDVWICLFPNRTRSHITTLIPHPADSPLFQSLLKKLHRRPF